MATESTRRIFCPETIEKKGEVKFNTFNDKFDWLNKKIINICKNDERACSDYAYLYLKYLENEGMIKIINIQKIPSPETLSRLRRNLFTQARNGNEDLKFLLKFDKDLNVNLDLESKQFYRNN